MSRPSRSLAWASLVVFAGSVIAPAQPAKPPADRMPVPDAAAIEKAEELVKGVYEADLSKKKPADLVELAGKLMQKADKIRGDPATRFVMYREARDLAARGGDVGAALVAAAALSRTFAVNANELKVATLEAAERARVIPARTVAEAALDAAEAAIAGDDYPQAGRLLKLAEVAAYRVSSAALVSGVKARVKELGALRKTFAALEPDRKTLGTNPNDPAANGRVGRFLCFGKRDWDAGLPHLAKGDDEKLKAVAELDLPGPVTAADRTALADRWLELSAGLGASERVGARLRAYQWYVQVLPDLTGPPKAQVEKRVAEIEKAGDPRAVRGIGWTVIFRSADPSIWNTDTDRGWDFARQLEKAPAGLRYLRLTELAKGNTVIIEATRNRLGKRIEYARYGWNGTNEQEFNGCHLGVYDLGMSTLPRGAVCIQVAFPGFRGWGFGHRSAIDDVQGYSWAGLPVEKTVFEIAVKAGPLTPEETKRLLKRRK